MQNFLRHFVRVRPGIFTCVRDGEFLGPNGRIQVTVGTTLTQGTSFMGVDMASELEEEYQKKNGHAASPLPSDHPSETHIGFVRRSSQSR